MKHYEITGKDAIHQFCFVSATDPALDPENEVSAGKAWFDTGEARVKFRNDANTAWAYLGIGDLEV